MLAHELPVRGDATFGQPADQLPRVLLVLDWFLKFVAPQAIALRRAGADVAMLHRTHLYEFNGCEEERDVLQEDVRAAGVRTMALPGRISSPLEIPAFMSLFNEIRRWHPEIVHAHDNHDPRLLALARAPRCVVTIHDPRPHTGARELNGMRARVRNAWLKKADRIVVHGAALKEILSETVPAELISVLPLGTDVASAPAPIPDRPTVLLFGRLEPYKGVEVLGNAMRLVWRERSDARLLVAGSGPEAVNVPTDPRVELMPEYISEERLPELFARASIVVLPYLDGSQSAVGLKAIGLGIPVLVTNVGSLPELATEPALVVPPADAEALAAGLLNALDHDLGLRRRTLEHARRNFSWEVVAERTLDLYREVLEA